MDLAGRARPAATGSCFPGLPRGGRLRRRVGRRLPDLPERIAVRMVERFRLARDDQHRILLVGPRSRVGLGVAERHGRLSTRYRKRLHDSARRRFPQPIADLIVKGLGVG